MGASPSRLNREPEHEGQAAESVDQPRANPGTEALLLALQRQAGNGAVSRLLDASAGRPPADGGQPLDDATRVDMESRFGEDLGDVRVHTGGEAAQTARDFSARSYATGDHIVFAPGAYEPGTESGQRLLAHELTHVVQQQGSTAAPPPLDPAAPHEAAAEAASQAFAGGEATPDAGPPTGTGMARSVDDWLVGTPDIQNWEYSELKDEIAELNQWLANQIATTDDLQRIEEAVAMLEAEKASKEKTAMAAPAKPKKRRRKGKKQAQEEEPIATEPQEPPRALVEQTSIQYEDDEEMRREFDRTVAWLQRKDVSPDDRKALQSQLMNLEPQLNRSVEQKSAVRRSERISQALTPKSSGDDRAFLVAQVSRVASIKPMSDRPGFEYLMDGNEMLVLTTEEADHIRNATQEALVSGRRGASSTNTGALVAWETQDQVNREERFASTLTWVFTSAERSSIAYERFMPYYRKAQAAIAEFEAMRKAGDLVGMANALAVAEENATIASQIVEDWKDGIMSGASAIVGGLTITRNVAFAVAGVIGAVVAAPIVAAGVAGMGATGLTATGLTALGTGGVVGGGTAIVQGGSAAAGTGLAGGSWQEVKEAGFEQGKQGFISGAKIGVTGPLAAGAGGAFGAGAQGLSRTGQFVRAGAASGGVNLAVETGSEAAQGRVISPTSAALAAGGGFFGGGGSALAGGIKNTTAQVLTQTGIGAGTGAGAAYIGSGGNIGATIEGAATGGIGALSVGGLRQPDPNSKAAQAAFRTGQSIGSKAQSVKRSASNVLGATMLGVALGMPPARGTGGGGGFGPTRTPYAASQMAGDTSAARVRAPAETPDVAPAPTPAPAATATPVAQTPPAAAQATASMPQAAPATPATILPMTVAAAIPPGQEQAPQTEPGTTMTDASIEQTFADAPDLNAPVSHVAPAQNPADLTHVQAQRQAEGMHAIRDLPALQQTIQSSNGTIGDGQTTLRDLTADNPAMMRQLWTRWEQGRANNEIKSDFLNYVRIIQRAHFRGGVGEQTQAFQRGRNPNEIFLKAPKSAENVTEPGIDFITLDTVTGMVRLGDNKSVRRNVRSVSALEWNLVKNLDTEINALQTWANRPDAPPQVAPALARMRAAKAALDAEVAANPNLPLDSTQMQTRFNQILRAHGIERVVTLSGANPSAQMGGDLGDQAGKGFTQE